MSAMPESDGADAGLERLSLPRVAPLGSDKRSQFYGLGTSVDIRLTSFSPVDHAMFAADGTVVPVPAGDAGEVEDLEIYALPAGPSVSLGQFLSGPLAQILAMSPTALAGGAALSARQTDVMARFGRLRDFVPSPAARRFRRIMVPVQGRSSLPATSLRQLADRIRGPRAENSSRIAILPMRQFERFCLTNRVSLTAWLRARRFTIVEPETIRLPDLIEHLASAGLILLADPRQAGLLGLCHPGARVIEVAPQGWLSATAHYYCTVFGLEWRPFLAAAPGYPLLGALPFGSLVPCSYEVSIRDLAKAIAAYDDPPAAT